MSHELSNADRAVIERAIRELELSCQYALAEDLRAIPNRASAATVDEPSDMSVSEKYRLIEQIVRSEPGCAAAPTQQQEGRKLDVSFIGGAQPTHYCKTCHAMWRRWPDGSWNLRSNQCGACCDNVEMGDQIAPMGHDGARATDGSAESIANALRPLSNYWDQEPKA